MPFGIVASDKDRRPAEITRRSLTLGAAAILLVGRGSAGAYAQAKSKTHRDTSFGGILSNPIEITVLSVAAGPAEERQLEGGRLIVPIHIAWETGPWGDRVLLDLKATLNIADDSGATVELTKDLGVKDKDGTLVLTLAEGRVPRTYRLTLVGQCRFTDADGKVRIEPTTAEEAGIL